MRDDRALAVCAGHRDDWAARFLDTQCPSHMSNAREPEVDALGVHRLLHLEPLLKSRIGQDVSLQKAF